MKWGLVGFSLAFLVLLSVTGPYLGRVRCAIALSLGAFAAWVLLGQILAGSLDPVSISALLPWLIGPGIAVVACRCAGMMAAKGLATATFWLTGLGALLAVFVLAPKLGLPYGPTTVRLESSGTFGNPNWAAAFLAPLIPLALDQVRERLGRARFVAHIVTGLLIAGVAASGSRGGLAAVLAGLVAYVFAAKKPVRPWVPAAIVMAAIATSVSLVAVARAGVLPPTFGLVVRGLYWTMAWHLATANPIMGVGPGAVFTRFPDVSRLALDAIPGAVVPLGPFEFVYHDVLEAMAEFGVVAGVLLVAIVGTTLQAALTAELRQTRVLGASFVVLVAHGLVDSPLHLPASGILWWLIVGLVAWQEGDAQAVGMSTPRPVRARWLCLALVLATLGAWQAFRVSVGIAAADRGHAALDQGHLREAAEFFEVASIFLPEQRHIHLRRGRVLAMLGQFRRARDAYERALARGLAWEAVFARAAIVEILEGPQKAQAEWAALAGAFPGVAQIYYEQARLAWTANDAPTATKLLERCVAVHRGWPGENAIKRKARALRDTIAAKNHPRGP